jgi:S-layer family protein
MINKLMGMGLAAVVAGVSGDAAAQVLAGNEFQVNVVTTGAQQRPSIAVRPDGDFVIVYESAAGDGSYTGVLGRRFDATGAALGGEFQVNTYTTDDQYSPSVAADAKGNFVVVWTSADGSSNGVFGQRFEASGARRGAEFQVNTYTTGTQGFSFRSGPFVASAADGRFVVAWTSSGGSDGSATSVQARRYDAQGIAQGDEFQVNAYTTAGQAVSSVSMAADGAFMFGFSSAGEDGSGSSAVARRFDASGNPIGGDFVVSGATAGGQYAPIVNMADDHGFVVDFAQPDANSFGLRGRRFDAAANALGVEFQVNTQEAGFQYGYAIGRNAAGDFVMGWSDEHEVFLRRFLADGTPRGGEFLVNTYTLAAQEETRLGSDDVGNLVVTWSSFSQDGSVQGVFAQRIGGLRPAALDVDTSGNRVWEPGEQVDVRPTWRNINGAAQTFGGLLVSLTGPAGAGYTMGNRLADYGTVASGASAPCADCYSVFVDNPAARPVQHWDASALESIAPDAQGQRKAWRLHIGGSFTDVPVTNPFYPFIETLLHRGVTGGCGGTAYCPASTTTRDQMSVFVLVAKEGAGYAPPACTTPVFNDVPASSPFCRFIEDLARRGVVSGCGGGDYCPAAAVTREQMAVFVLRTLDPALDPPACTAPVFGDVPAGSPFCKWIEELARRGVVGGCGGGDYCPAAPVSREQMGVFIGATFGLTLYGP